MPKYECRTCENTFVQADTANRQCPACGSNNIAEVYEEPQQPNTFSLNIGLIVSCIVIVLMFIVLFVLPYERHRYLASVSKVPADCGFSINLTEYGYPVDSTIFKFSIDNGAHYHDQPNFTVKEPGIFNVKLKMNDLSSRDTVYFAFRNPIPYVPAAACMPPPVDPCDCKNLRITGVEKMKIANKDAVVVHVSLPKCNVEYSISGINGKYQPDSVFSKFAASDSIFVKTAKCPPVAYSGNPFIPNPVAAVVVKPDQPKPAAVSRKYYQESEVYPKPYPPLYESRRELEEYLSQEIQKEMGSHSEIVIAFTVETTGDLSGFKNINNVSQTLHDCAKRKINKGGSWYPGYKSDNPVDTYVIIRIPAN
jgi:hypothetical protein